MNPLETFAASPLFYPSIINDIHHMIYNISSLLTSLSQGTFPASPPPFLPDPPDSLFPSYPSPLPPAYSLSRGPPPREPEVYFHSTGPESNSRR